MLDPTFTAGGPISGAAIVTKGSGNGGEQFNLDCGGPAGGAYTHTFRFFIRDTSGAVHTGTANVGPEPGVWHHLVGVVDEANSNVVLYVDGLLNGSGTVSPTNGIQSSSLPVTIGARSANAVILPSWTVGAIVCVPGGAHPSYAQGYYKRDNAYYKAWDAISRDRDAFLAWIKTNVLGRGPDAFATYAAAEE